MLQTRYEIRYYSITMPYGSKLQILAESLKKEILSGELPVGSIMPSIQKMQDMYNLSRNTIVGALKILNKENIITREGAARQGYRIIAQPNGFSSDLNFSNQSINFLLPFNYWNYVGSQLINSFEKGFSRKHINLIFSNHRNSTTDEKKILERILSRNEQKLKGILLMSSSSFDNPNIELLQKINTYQSLILIDRYIEGLDCHYIGINNRRIGNDAAHYLMERGHKDMAFLSGFSRVSTISDRLHGFRQAIEKHGLLLPPHRIIQETSLFETFDSCTHSGEFLGDTLLNQSKLPTAIFCGSDKTAAGLIRYLKSKSIRVPEDISIISCDDDIIQQNSLNRKLTTFAYPYPEITNEILHLLDNIDIEEKFPIRTIELNTEFIPGETVMNIN